MADARAFDPSKPFTRAAAPAPAFDPSKPFTKSGGTPAASPVAAAGAPEPGPSSTGSGASLMAKAATGRSGSQMGGEKPSFDDFMQGAETWARGASFGWSDDASAALATAILKAKGDPRAMGEIYQQLDQAENERIDAFKKANPGTGNALEIGGMFTGPGVARLGQWIGRGAGWLGKMGRASAVGGGAGAAAGAGNAKPGEKIKGAEIGGATGAVLGPVAERAASFIGPQISSAARFLRDRGVRPTIGQNVGGAAKAAEEKVSSIPIAGDLIKNQQRRGIEDFNRAAYNEVLAPLGTTVKPNFPVGNQGFDGVNDIISSRYDALLPKLNLRVDAQLQADLAAVDAAASALPKAQQKAYMDLMNTQFANKLTSGTMTGTTFKGAESELGREIRGLSKDPSWDQKKLGEVLKQAQAAMREALNRSNPHYQGQLSKINQAYALLTRVQNAAAKLGAKDGIFTPSQLLSGAKRGATEKTFARGKAPLQELAQAGDEVLSNKYPDSGSIGRLLLSEGALGAVSPKAAAGVGALSVPYLMPRGWNASPLAQSTGSMLRNMIPGMAGEAGKETPRAVPRYIGAQ